MLLWAQCKSIPRDEDYSPIVGYWNRSIERWKVAPEHLNSEEELVPSHCQNPLAKRAQIDNQIKERSIDQSGIP